MKKQLSILFLILLLLPGLAGADCATAEITDDIRLDIPCAEYDGNRYRIILDMYKNPFDPSNLYFKYTAIEYSSAGASCALIDDMLNISVSCVEVQGTSELQGSRYTLFLERYANGEDPSGFYWKTVSIGNAGDGSNNKPVASSISLNVNSSVPYIVQQLSAHDPDNDVISYELISPSTGAGYSDAYINPSSGKLYLTHAPAGNNSFSISFRATDGQLFSDSANVDVQVEYLSEDSKNTGRNDVDPEDYSRFALSTFNSDLFGMAGGQPTTPRSIDLSANFPTPGDQGNQNSCVGWATAYALKSYQEKVEIGWALNTPDHLFSPAFLYNQINYGQDQGSYINEAMELAVNKGLATLASMPYSDQDYLSRPSASAISEALKFKAANWRRVNDTSQIKAALANGRPVVGGIAVYQQLMQLTGANSLYNTSTGSNQGGHAITIVGYDDDKYGGAFKVINSWGQRWGDNGFFWMDYDFAASGIMSEAYVLEDAENTGEVVPVEPTQPEPNQNLLPNLTVENWSASYDPRPRGAGSLEYRIKNIGSGVAPEGAYVALMLSRNPDFSSSDDMVVYEIIPELKPGQAAYRDQNSAIEFRFPDRLAAGTYYMAVVVDHMNVVDESIENDNFSSGDNPVLIENNLPDLIVNTWYAKWDGYGNGTLTYEVINDGASSTTSMDWEVNLILDRDQTVGNGNELFLFYESTQYLLEPGGSIFRNASNSAFFNLYQTQNGNSVPSGTYYMALWVDDRNVEAESNELNNGSYWWDPVRIGSGYRSSLSTLNSLSTRNYGDSDDDNIVDYSAVAEAASGVMETGKAYNGRKLPPQDLIWKKVEVVRTMNGFARLKAVDEPTEQKMAVRKSTSGYSKKISARTKVIFPTASSIEMQ